MDQDYTREPVGVGVARQGRRAVTRDEAVAAAVAGALVRIDGGQAVMLAFMASDVSRTRSSRAKAKVRTSTGRWLSVDAARLSPVADEDLPRLRPLFEHLTPKETPCA